MRFSIAAALLGAALAGGCQFVAGVRTDAVRGTGGGAGSTSTGGEGGEASGGSGGGGPCSAATCSDGACKSGVCVKPKCDPHGGPFDVLTAADLANAEIDARLGIVSVGRDVHVAALDTMGHELVIRTLHGGSSSPVGPMTTVTLPGGGGASFSEGWGDETMVVFAGRFGDSVGEVQVPLDGQGVMSGGMASPYPALPAACPQGSLHTAHFVRDGQKTRFAAYCEGTSSFALLTGDATSSEVIGSSATKDPSLKLEALALVNGSLVMAVGEGGSTGFFTRTGKTAAELGTAVPLKFDASAGLETGILGMLSPPAGTGLTLFGAAFTPPPGLKGYIWAGVVEDLSKLGDVPPPGTMPVVGPDPLAVIGVPGPVAATSSGVFMPAVPSDQARVLVTWFSDAGEPLLLGAPVFDKGAGASDQVLAATAAMADLDLFVVWTEGTNEATAVRGQRLICTY